MFDLNQEIDRWKRAFTTKGTCSKDELEELESHLREEIAAMVAAGHSHEAAFRQSVARLGDAAAVCGEFAKIERPLLWDYVAIRANSVLVVLVTVAAVVSGLVVWTQRGDGLLGAHRGSITFAYVVPFLLAVVGTYAIVRAAFVKSVDASFRDRLAGHCRFLLGVVAIWCAAGAILGGFWAARNWGRFWAWDLKEIGALCVVSCALVLFTFVTKYRPASLHLGQACLIMSLVTFAAWFGPAVYSQAVGPGALALLGVCLAVQLAMLSASLLVPKRTFAEN
jgi:ABC-type transport system involved in cytochrome c biogenesis permease subunit